MQQKTKTLTILATTSTRSHKQDCTKAKQSMQTQVKLSTFVKEKVNLSLGLSNEITLDMLSHRELCLKEGVDKLQVDGDGNELVRKNMDGIRLGLDFIELIPTSHGENPYDANRDVLDGSSQTVLLALENGVNRLIAHYADLFIRSVQGDKDDWITSASYASHRDKMITDVREALLSSYFLGWHDGHEHGKRELNIMLGNNPSAATWYSYVLPLLTTSERCDKRKEATKSSRFALVPVRIDLPADRTEQWNSLLHKLEDAIDSLETVTLNLLRFRVRLFFLRQKFTPVNLGSSEKFETLICSKVAVVTEKMYNMGFFNGVEEGQAHVKESYKRFRDDKVYALLDDNKRMWTLVDTAVSFSCECGQCPPCIGKKTRTSSGGKLLNRRFAADELRSIAKECVGIQFEKR